MVKKEKEIRISLPDGSEFRRVEVTDGGRAVSVFYNSNDSVDISNSLSKPVSKAFPKPKPLVGGTEVYQKKGTPYWYCKIKDGRDEFMNLYFGDLTKDDVLYDNEGKKRKFVKKNQEIFRENLINTLENIPKEGFRWIPVYEPSEDAEGNLQYVSEANVVNYGYEWENVLQNYSPENGSRMASTTTYFLLLLRLLKDGFATIEQLADDSAEIGHYLKSENSKYDIEKTGQRQLGGIYGFAGNTQKVVKNSSESLERFGGCFYAHGYLFPVARSLPVNSPIDIKNYCVGLLELTK